MRSETVVSEFQTQQKQVTNTPVRLALAGSFKCTHGVRVKALKGNTKKVWVCNTNQLATHGFELQPGDEVFIPVDQPEKIWVVAETADAQTLAFLMA